jgi:hypothetical protein
MDCLLDFVNQNKIWPSHLHIRVYNSVQLNSILPHVFLDRLKKSKNILEKKLSVILGHFFLSGFVGLILKKGTFDTRDNFFNGSY